MNREGSMQDIWTETDRHAIQRMSQKTPQSMIIRDDERFTSSDETSDYSDSDSSSKNSYAAVPQEFRPSQTPSKSLTMRRKSNKAQFHSNQASLNSFNVPQKLEPNISSNKITAVKREGEENSLDSNQSSSNSAKGKVSENLPKSAKDKISCDQDTKSLYYLSPTEHKFTTKAQLLERKKLSQNNSPRGRIAANLCSSTVKHGDNFPVETKSLVDKNNTASKLNSAEIKQKTGGKILTNLSLKEQMTEENLLKESYTSVKKQKPKGKITFEVIVPENVEKSLETCPITGATKYKEHSTMKMYRNSAFPFNGTRLSPTFKEPGNNKCQNKPVFECIVSEEIEISRTQTIKFDFAEINKNSNTNSSILINGVKIQQLPRKMKKMSRNQKKSNLEQINYKQRNKYSITTKFLDFPQQRKPVKWNSDLNLNKQNESLQPNFRQKSSDENFFQDKTREKFKWAVVQENEVTVQRNKITKNKGSIPELMNDEEAEGLESISRTCKHSHTSRDKRYVAKDKKSVPGMMKNATSNINQQENSEYTHQVRSPNLKPYLNKNNLVHDHDTNLPVATNSNNFRRENGKHTSDKKINCSSHSKKIQNYSREVKENKEIKCDNLVKDNPSHGSLPFEALNIKSKDLTLEENSPLIQYGKNISDLIIGSYAALSTFFSFYNEWRVSRSELISHFQQLEKSIRDSSKKYKRYQDLPKVVNNVALVAANIPHPYIAIAAKVVSIISSLMQHFFNKAKKDKVDMDEPEITGLLLTDISASNDLYMYGLQCNQQLEETAKLIEEFHTKAKNPEFLNACVDADIKTFMKGMLAYDPKQCTFYKKLYKCFQELLQTGSSPCSKNFCEPFILNSSYAMDAIGYLDWRFHDFNNVSVKYELEDIHRMIQSDTSTSMEEVANKIKNCVRILNDELRSAERCVSKVSLFYSSFENSKSNSK